MKINVSKEVGEVLTYMAALERETLDAFVGSILDNWLTENYCDRVEAGERSFFLASTVIGKGRKLDEKAAYRQMRANYELITQ
jgi:hypothetical protein